MPISAPYLESTVAAIRFNRLAQEIFEKHNCAARKDDGPKHSEPVQCLPIAVVPAQSRFHCTILRR
jgi:hypothetical protein